MKIKMESETEKEHLMACMDVLNMLEGFCRNLDVKIDKEQQELKACKKNTEVEEKLTQERKLNNELNDQLSKLNDRSTELDRVCTNFESHLTIAESDQNRLDSAKENYQVAKELTGIRFDFSAPPDVAKGYIKSESRKLLQPFEVPAADTDGLWSLVQNIATPGWPNSPDKENSPDN